MRWPRRGERGSVSVEVAILAPAFLGLLALAGVAGRTAIAAQAVEAAAHDAARAASISRDADTARTAAQTAAQQRLDWAGLNCMQPPSLAFQGTVGGQSGTFNAAFNSSVGQDATVTVRVSCVVSFHNLQMPTLPGMPAEKLVGASFTSPLDRYRSRG